MRLINLLVKVVSCARKRGCAIKREGAVFGTFTVYIIPIADRHVHGRDGAVKTVALVW